MENWAIVLSALSALFAAIAAGANLGQARKASQANEVNVYLGMLQEYRSEEMRVVLSNLASFWRESGGNICEYFKEETTKNPERATTLHEEARKLTSYFVNSARLFEGGFVSRRTLEFLISHPGLNVFYEVAAPLRLAKNPRDDVATYIPLLKSIVESHGDGIY
jgi:hypothetical protein